jgi:SAM-dependent methyltransferase
MVSVGGDPWTTRVVQKVTWAVARRALGAGGPIDRYLATRKQALLGVLRGYVVEIGPGEGASLRHLPLGVRWIGVEPDPVSRASALREARRVGIMATVLDGRAEALPLADRSVDAVISTLVLCSVDDLAKTLSEVRRVLRPHGRFVFIEHVGAERGTRLRGVQERLAPWWLDVTGECRMARDTEASIRSAGFGHVEVERFSMGPGVSPVSPGIAGVAMA